jgi:hypothetical protein
MAEMQSTFTFVITLQFLAVVFHDWVDIPGWTTGRQVQAVVGRRRLLIATAINAMFPGLAVALALWFWNTPTPAGVVNYWIIYCTVTLGSAVVMWYVPYFFGASAQQSQDYDRMYAGTHHILPPRGDNPRPNVTHIGFHALFVVSLILAVALRLHA